MRVSPTQSFMPVLVLVCRGGKDAGREHSLTFPVCACACCVSRQSGKANRLIDSRSDLYSLGCIFYELLCGHPPFQSHDTLELIHQHLAKLPPPLMPKHLSATEHPLLHALLTVVSSMTMKLLNKQAEERYQSTAGLIHDLNFVLVVIRTLRSDEGRQAGTMTAAAMAATQRLQSFQMGQMDHYSIFRISQRLYGREEDVQHLINSYQQVARGLVQPPLTESEPPESVAPQLCLISGYSGVGKTSLVDELHKHIVRERGLFAHAKFDLLKRDSSALLHAFRVLVLQLLVQDPLMWKVCETARTRTLTPANTWERAHASDLERREWANRYRVRARIEGRADGHPSFPCVLLLSLVFSGATAEGARKQRTGTEEHTHALVRRSGIETTQWRRSLIPHGEWLLRVLSPLYLCLSLGSVRRRSRAESTDWRTACSGEAQHG